MPHVTTAKSLAFSLDPRATSQLSWLTHAASIALGTSVRKSTVLRFALACLTELVSTHARAGSPTAVQAAFERLPEFTRSAPPGRHFASDIAGRLLPWDGATR